MSDKKITTNKAAELISSLLQIGTYSDAEKIFEKFKTFSQAKIDENNFGSIVIEMTHFYINIVDRLIFQQLNGEHGKKIFNEIVDLVLKSHLENTYKSAKINIHPDVFCKMFSDTHEKRQLEYGAYDFLPKEEGLKGNLFWEFEKKLAEIVNIKDDPLVNVSIHEILMTAVEKFSKVIHEILLEVDME